MAAILQLSISLLTSAARSVCAFFQPYYLEVQNKYITFTSTTTTTITTSSSSSCSSSFSFQLKKARRWCRLYYLFLVFSSGRLLFAGWAYYRAAEEQNGGGNGDGSADKVHGEGYPSLNSSLDIGHKVYLDLTLHFVLQYAGLRRSSLLFVIAPIPLSGVVWHCLLYYRPDGRTWRRLYDVLVVATLHRYSARYLLPDRRGQRGGGGGEGGGGEKEKRRIKRRRRRRRRRRRGGRVRVSGTESSNRNGSSNSNSRSALLAEVLAVLYRVNWRYAWGQMKKSPSLLGNEDDAVLALTNIYLFLQAAFYACCAGK